MVEPPAWGTEAPGFMVGDVQVITKVDLALHHRGVSFTVYDWKTGNGRGRLGLFAGFESDQFA